MVCVRVLCGLSGELLCAADLPSPSQVANLKAVIKRKEGTPTSEQRLHVADRLLDDAELLNDIVVATAAQQQKQLDEGEELVLDLLDVLLLRRQCTEAATLESLDEVRLGSWLRVLRDAASVRKACGALGLEMQDSGEWEAAAGRCGQVVAFDPLEGTVEVRVPGVGDVWLALAALTREEVEEDGRVREEVEGQPAKEEDAEAVEEQAARAEAEEAAARADAEEWAAQRMERLREELQQLEYCEASERRARLRALQLELHPDKQPPARRARVQPLFLLVRKEWELTEAWRQPPEERCQEPQREPNVHQPAAEKRPPAPAEGETSQAEPSVPVPMRLELRITSGGSLVCALSAERNWIVYDVKEAVEVTAHLPPNAQRLCLDGEELDDADLLSGFPNRGIVELSLLRKPQVPCSGFVEKVRKHWRMLQHAPPGPKADRSVVLAALRQSGLALQHAAPPLRADRKLALFAVSRSWQALEFVAEGLKTEPELVIAGARQDWRALELVAPCGCRKALLEAVQQSWEALQFASPALQADLDLLQIAVRQSGLAMQHAAERLQGHRPLALAAVHKDGAALQWLSQSLRADREVVLAAVRQNGNAFAHAAVELRAERNFVLQAVRGNGAALRFVADGLRADQDVALVACMERG